MAVRANWWGWPGCVCSSQVNWPARAGGLFAVVAVDAELLELERETEAQCAVQGQVLPAEFDVALDWEGTWMAAVS